MILPRRRRARPCRAFGQWGESVGEEYRTDGFTFFASYYDGAKFLAPDERTKFFLAILDYAFEGIEPKFGSTQLSMAWALTVPTIDSGITSRKYGKMGGRKRKAKDEGPNEKPALNTALETGDSNHPFEPPFQRVESNTPDNPKEEKRKRNEVEVRDVAPTAADSRTDLELSKIVQHYQLAIGDFPRSALDMLQKWRETFPADVLCAALDEAAENGHRSWRYINGILSGWKADGVRTLGDVAARREARKKPEQKERTMLR